MLRVLGGGRLLANNAGVMLLGPFDADPVHRGVTDRRGLPPRGDECHWVFLDQLRDGGGGLDNLRCVAGCNPPRASNAVYTVHAAAKLGINGWSDGFRQELQPDLRVTLIEPGAIATGISHRAFGGKRDAEQLYEQAAIDAGDVAEVIAVAVAVAVAVAWRSRPRHLMRGPRSPGPGPTTARRPRGCPRFDADGHGTRSLLESAVPGGWGASSGTECAVRRCIDGEKTERGCQRTEALPDVASKVVLTDRLARSQ